MNTFLYPLLLVLVTSSCVTENKSLTHQQRIESIENEMMKLGEKIEVAYHQMKKNNKQYTSFPLAVVLKPFYLIDHNRKTLSTRRFLDVMEQKKEYSEIGNIFYEWMSNAETMGIYALIPAYAFYYQKAQSVFLRDDFNSSSLLDQLVLYHELVHAAEDMDAKMFVLQRTGSLQYYYDFWQKAEGSTFPLSEVDAYAKQIEVLNLLTDGQLMDLGTVSAQDLATILDVPLDEYKDILTSLSYVSTAYYSTQNPDSSMMNLMNMMYTNAKLQSKMPSYTFDFIHAEYIMID